MATSPRRSVPRERRSVPRAPAEIENSPGPSTAPSTTESQLVALLTDARREADALRRELSDERKKTDTYHRQLQALSNKSPNQEVRVLEERLARAEAALEDAESRSRFVERHWLQVERYLTMMQHQAADSRASFTRLMEQGEGILVPPNGSPPTQREIPPRLHNSSSGPGHYDPSQSNHRRRSSSTTISPRSPVYVRSAPLIPPRRHPSPPPRSPVGADEGRWHNIERGDRSPPYKRQHVWRSDDSRPQYSRAPSSPSLHRAPASPPAPTREPDPRYPSREYRPPPPPLPRVHTPPPPQPYQPSEALRSYDARNPPLQFIPHRHPPVPPRPISPPVPQPPPRTGSAADASHQYQHRFHLNAGSSGNAPRRPVRPGAYETMVFALDESSDPPPLTQGRREEY
ncbi:hypothetical protein R3P38DRAFT_2848594 [Favolaschia claudopus]|uniref:Uncharacterized protein n=1 Tax=Favolaschia claudopus TaxID=2862362 RepID=A0AAW0DWR4_9AGAR